MYVQTAFTRPTQRQLRCFLFAELCWDGADGTCAFTFPLYFRLRFLGLHVRNATTRANAKNDVFPILFSSAIELASAFALLNSLVHTCISLGLHL